MITIAALVVAGVGPTQAKQMFGPLVAACARFDINTPARQGAFVGQCMVETGIFTELEERLYYSDPARIAKVFSSSFRADIDAEIANQMISDPKLAPIAAEAIAIDIVVKPYAKNPQALGNRVYANKNGNGDEASGDGFRYRGRGCIQITGRHNYSDASIELGVDYMGDPDQVSQPGAAALTAAWYWMTIKANLLADSWAIDAITRQVNGPAMRDTTLRRQFSEQARQAFT